MSLAVARLRTTIHSLLPVAEERCAAWVSAFAAQDGDALGGALIPSGEWLLIRHLRVDTRWRSDEADVDAGRLWGQALRCSIQEAIAHGENGNCVRYANRGAALADLMYRSACGERTRQWAWQQMQLIDCADTDCSAVLESGVRQLLNEPEWVWPVIRRIIDAEEQTGSFTAVLRRLPRSSWGRLFATCPQTAPYVSPGFAAGEAEQPDDALAAEAVAMKASPPGRALMAWAESRAYFAARHVDVVTVLLAALVWPWPERAGERSRRRARLARQQLVVSTRARMNRKHPWTLPPVSDRQSPAPVVEQDEWQNLDDTRRAPAESVPALPALPDSTTWLSTEWGGALFWLSRLTPTDRSVETGFEPDASHAELRVLLYAIARALGVPDSDAAMAAFCGGAVPQGEVPPHLTTHADSLVHRWNAWLHDVAPELPEPRALMVCRRRGRLRLEPGWVELHLPLTAVTIAIRRIGLDLDPGWLPWLGCVVRICYDE